MRHLENRYPFFEINREGGILMVMWQRLALTAVLVIAFSFAVGLIWVRLFGFELPSYLGGISGGLIAVPAWEFLQRFAPKLKKNA